MTVITRSSLAREKVASKAEPAKRTHRDHVEYAPLKPKDLAIIDKHFASAGRADGGRVEQWVNGISQYYADSGRLWVVKDNKRRHMYQQHFYHSVNSVASTLICAHPLKLWDLRRYATPRETARLQGFPESFTLPATRYNKLFGNAVAVSCARFAASHVCDETEEIRFVDVCAGIGGFHLGVTGACPRAKCVGFSEICPAATACYRANFPDAPVLGDATQAAWPACDLLCAGFPCQPFSTCNTRTGREEHANRDFFLVVLDALRATGATRVVLENVPTLVFHGAERWAELQHTLSSELGFAIDYAVLNAHDFGLPQKRKRLYIVGRRDGVLPRPLEADKPVPEARPTLETILDAQCPS